MKNILRQAYGRKEAVTDELIDKILSPGLEAGAVDVFLDFISYSSGPLPEELLALTKARVSILWGEADPWESHTLGKALFSPYACVEEFITLPGIGHCPQVGGRVCRGCCVLELRPPHFLLLCKYWNSSHLACFDFIRRMRRQRL